MFCLQTVGDRRRRFADEEDNAVEGYFEHVQQERLESMHCPIHLVIDHRYYQIIGKGGVAGKLTYRKTVPLFKCN